ncbi:uncharacterized protein [Rutidosis leptorrhynchoides]|uniref:uncharacterized protein n=1 Tax=Rutidosis leptorrhynchoides TaxID=125765 RepID=UPI003A990612
MSQQQHNNNNGSTDLECGSEITSEFFTDAEEEKDEEEEEYCSSSSCYSQHEFYSTYGDEDKGEGDGDVNVNDILSRTVSSSSLFSDDCCSVVTGPVIDVHLQDNNSCKECRICHMSVNDMGNNDAIELGCSCKHDLAVAHKDCAITWFKIKGNKTCEICNSIVSNLVVPNDMMPSTQDHVTMDVNPTVTVRGAHNIMSRRGGCINGHRLLNFILACLVFTFVISWLFHFNIPS